MGNSGKALRCQFVKCPFLLYQYIKKIIYGLLLPVPFRGADLLMVLVGPRGFDMIEWCSL